MLFLDIEVPTPTIPPSDSIRAVTENIIKQATTDPESFWHGVLDSAIHFGLKVLVAFCHLPDRRMAHQACEETVGARL